MGSQTHYFLKDAAGVEQRLLFDVDPGLAPGAPLKVWGAPQGQALRVSSFERAPVPATPTIQAALIGAQPFPARTFAFVLIDIGGGVNRTTDDVMARMIDAPDSIRNYYMYASYGMQDITAKVVGPISYTPTECDTSAMTRALRSTGRRRGGPFSTTSGTRQQERRLCLERSRVGRDPGRADPGHLVQRLHQLHRAGPGAGAQLRHAALVVAGVRQRDVRRRSEHAASSSEYGDRSTRWAAAAAT